MTDVATTTFDLIPPNEDQLRNLEADLSEDERHVLLLGMQQRAGQEPFFESSKSQSRIRPDVRNCPRRK